MPRTSAGEDAAWLARRARRSLLSTALAAFAVLPGCTFLGAGIGAMAGASSPGPFELHPAPRRPLNAAQFSQRFELTPGDIVHLELRGGRIVEGKYRGLFGPTKREPQTYLVIQDSVATRLAPPSPGTRVPARVMHIAPSEVRQVGVEVTGNAWLVGGLIGVTVDVLVVGSIGYICATGGCEFSD